MKITPKNNLKSFSLPLPIYNIIHIADAMDKNGGEFSIFVGLDKNLISQLKVLSLDESDAELQKNTGDKKRFGQGSYEDWHKKNRTPFALVHKATNALAALVWFGPKPLGKKSMKFGKEKEYEIKNNWQTIAFRSYPPFRGKGLMINFSQFVINIYKKQFTNIKFWVGTDDGNTAFMKLISELGFKVDKKISDLSAHWLVMTKY